MTCVSIQRLFVEIRIDATYVLIHRMMRIDSSLFVGMYERTFLF